MYNVENGGCIHMFWKKNKQKEEKVQQPKQLSDGKQPTLKEWEELFDDGDYPLKGKTPHQKS